MQNPWERSLVWVVLGEKGSLARQVAFVSLEILSVMDARAVERWSSAAEISATLHSHEYSAS